MKTKSIFLYIFGLMCIVSCVNTDKVVNFVAKNPQVKELICDKPQEKHTTDTIIKEKIVIQEPTQEELDNYTNFMRSIDSMECVKALDSLKAKLKPQTVKIKYITTTIYDTVTVIDNLAVENGMNVQRNIDSTYYNQEINRIKASQPSGVGKILAWVFGCLLVLAIGFIIALFVVIRTAKNSKQY